MTISMYQACVPVLARSLRNLDHILDKGIAHAEAKKLDPAVLFAWRLAPDMLPLSRQVQIASDIAKGCPARLAGSEPPKYADDETTFADLRARVAKTIAYVEGFTPAQIDGSEQRSVTLQMRSGDLSFSGIDYLFNFVLPNVHFHVTTTYAILRHCGVDLGKRDFLGGS